MPASAGPSSVASPVKRTLMENALAELSVPLNLHLPKVFTMEAEPLIEMKSPGPPSSSAIRAVLSPADHGNSSGALGLELAKEKENIRSEMPSAMGVVDCGSDSHP